MFSIYTDKLRNEVATIQSALTTHDRVRALVYSPEETALPAASGGPDLLSPLKTNAPPLLAWRIYDHCAAFTRLYAVYERFVADIVSEWLTILPDLYRQYSDLPEAVRNGHRVGAAEILQKIGGDRYAHLSEESVLRGIFEGVAGNSPYQLLFDAFMIDEQNLRHDILTKLFARIGISGAWGWVNTHGAIQRFIDEVRGNSSSAESELRSFVLHRNDAAHGEVDEVVATDEIKKVADFIVILCNVLAELMMRQAVMRRIDLGQATTAGTVIHQFQDRVVGAQMKEGVLNVGDELIILRDQACYKVIVESIEVDHTPYQQLQVSDGQNVGMRLSASAKVSSQIILPANPPVTQSAVPSPPTTASATPPVVSTEIPAQVNSQE